MDGKKRKAIFSVFPCRRPDHHAIPAGTALKDPWSHGRLWLTALTGLAADLWTKHWALSAIGDPDRFNPADPDTYLRPVILIKHYLSFVTVYNRGAVGGMAQGKTLLLIIASCIALGFLFWLFITTQKEHWIRHLALGCLCGGALGNLYDRLFNAGKVVDFIEVNLHVWPANPWPTFNIADILLCAGVGVLLLSLLKPPQKSGQ